MMIQDLGSFREPLSSVVSTHFTDAVAPETRLRDEAEPQWVRFAEVRPGVRIAPFLLEGHGTGRSEAIIQFGFVSHRRAVSNSEYNLYNEIPISNYNHGMFNPSGRVPSQVRDDGLGVEDGRLIAAYLDRPENERSPTIQCHELIRA
jgi:hypothetical protein